MMLFKSWASISQLSKRRFNLESLFKLHVCGTVLISHARYIFVGTARFWLSCTSLVYALDQTLLFLQGQTTQDHCLGVCLATLLMKHLVVQPTYHCALQPGVVHMTRHITFFVLQLKNCLRCGRFIGTFCIRVVLSAKHLVSNKGHITHA